MKILFLGYAVSSQLANVLSGASIAGNKMQVNMLKELADYPDVKIDIITVYPLAPFPREKELFIASKIIKIADNLSTQRVSFLNIPIIKQIWQMISVYCTATKKVDKDTIIFTFNMFPQVGIPAVCLKRMYKCRLYSLLADLPIDDFFESKKRIRNYLRKKFEKITEKIIKKCDGLIVLNENAIRIFAPDTPFIVVEGGVSKDEIRIFEGKYDKKNIVYTGALTPYSGIKELISAMSIITHKDVVLDIYGSGYLEEEIRTISQKVSNIKFYGKVNYEKILDIQRNAYLLVNPRPVNDPIAMVTFPSKMFEYMTSGTPVLTTKLNGLTDEFLEHVFVTENDRAEGIATKIDEIMDLPIGDLNIIASKAYDFIVTKKSWKEQSAKIYHFLKRC